MDHEAINAYISSVVRPVMFSSDPDSPWGFGAAFFVRFKNDVFVVTARHVIELQKGEYQDFRIFANGHKYAVPFNRYSLFTLKMEDSADYSDLVIFRVDQELHSSGGGKRLNGFSLPHNSYPAEYIPSGTVLLVAGYPENEDRYDHDLMMLNHTLLLTSGKFGASLYGDPIYQFNGAPSEHSFRGMSGSPVFTTFPDGEINLVGVVVRGGSSSGIFHFIDVSLLIAHIIRSSQ